MRTVLLVEDNPTDVFVIKEVIDRCELDLELRVGMIVAPIPVGLLISGVELGKTQQTSHLESAVPPHIGQ